MNAQDGVQHIQLINASFEDEPQDATTPGGWHACKPGSTPDILPGVWGVYNESSDGDTYMGLITREDGTWESIGQRLGTPIKKGECYDFTVDLARSKTYANYNIPIRLRIWAGRTKCSKDQLLGESTAIQNTEWETHKFSFTAAKKYNYVIIEAYYVKGITTPYKGNILVDNISIFKQCIKA